MNKLFSFVVIATLFTIATFAHPPSEIVAEYDTTSKILQIIVNHSVRDAQKHYINKVEIELNGSKIIEQKSNKQIDNKIQHYIYKIHDARTEDSISIEANCNISGKKKVKVLINQIIKKSEE
ncbi:MAG: hypothetical protein N3A65_03390 [candidate division WOR-3 bacterium]|nr:hypothetical protein [candidate division WOR-3 bacterium]